MEEEKVGHKESFKCTVIIKKKPTGRK